MDQNRSKIDQNMAFRGVLRLRGLSASHGRCTRHMAAVSVVTTEPHRLGSQLRVLKASKALSKELQRLSVAPTATHRSGEAHVITSRGRQELLNLGCKTEGF